MKKYYVITCKNCQEQHWHPKKHRNSFSLLAAFLNDYRWRRRIGDLEIVCSDCVRDVIITGIDPHRYFHLINKIAKHEYEVIYSQRYVCAVCDGHIFEGYFSTNREKLCWEKTTPKVQCYSCGEPRSYKRL